MGCYDLREKEDEGRGRGRAEEGEGKKRKGRGRIGRGGEKEEGVSKRGEEDVEDEGHKNKMSDATTINGME